MSGGDLDRYTIRQPTSLSDADTQGLARVLIDCVDGGASVGFMHPVSMETALAFWRRVAREVERGTRALLVAENAAGIVGTDRLGQRSKPQRGGDGRDEKHGERHVDGTI